jgi:hypothetical protein
VVNVPRDSPSGDRIGRISERERKVGLNEALFREVNERIERVSDALQIASERLGILCECGDISCMEQLEVPQAEFERIRQDATLFFVRNGHEDGEAEDIVEHHDHYDVVRKKADAARLARKLDSRS